MKENVQYMKHLDLNIGFHSVIVLYLLNVLIHKQNILFEE